MSDILPVVTVTYSPGPHLDRFLASLSHATERPVTVVMADNGSTDGAPEAAVELIPACDCARPAANLGYGGAVNRAVANSDAGDEFFVVANPDVRGDPAASTSCSTPRDGGRARARWAR